MWARGQQYGPWGDQVRYGRLNQASLWRAGGKHLHTAASRSEQEARANAGQASPSSTCSTFCVQLHQTRPRPTYSLRDAVVRRFFAPPNYPPEP
ncbi:hypothetical protein NDU88_005507 [Pleurodeles waltl]|uniref:Uncharacterized protein n=1 Tax=Pleurodeles waltl TaxID=8319 RepID=A0AAV7UIA1_PLEWA|nr:hypothetical protein NDU88_005507 [Pleurodeles waltl]